MKAEIVSIGTEILLGQITDTNASYLAGQLPLMGIDLFWVSQVGDNRRIGRNAIQQFLYPSYPIIGRISRGMKSHAGAVKGVYRYALAAFSLLGGFAFNTEKGVGDSLEPFLGNLPATGHANSVLPVFNPRQSRIDEVQTFDVLGLQCL